MAFHKRSDSKREECLEVEADKDGWKYLFLETWEKQENGAPIASFSLDCEGDNTGLSWPAVLCGIAPGTVADFFFWYEYSPRGIKRKIWKAFLKEFFISNPALLEHGFVLTKDGGGIMKPVKLDLDCLAENFQNPDCCFDPISDALEDICAVINIFNKLIAEAATLSE